MNSNKITESQRTFEMKTLRLSHRENEKCGLKKMSKQCQYKKNKNKASSNEKFITEVH